MICIYRDVNRIKTSAPALYAMIQTMDTIVEQNAQRAMNISALDSNNPKLSNWIGAVRLYWKTKQRALLYRAYGYAVEELSNQEIGNRFCVPQNGYRVDLQRTVGMTRPDIILTNTSNDQQIAWLDITSENSATHIFQKSGSGWTTRPFVAELVYPALQLEEIRTAAQDGIGVRAHSLAASRQIAMRNRKLKDHLMRCMGRALRDWNDMTAALTKSGVARTMQVEFEVPLPRVYHPAIKSMLKLWLDNSHSDAMNEVARRILDQYYKNDRQDLATAMCYVADSYRQEEERQKIYQGEFPYDIV